MVSEGLPGVGWQTYVGDPRAAALRHDSSLKSLIFEEMPDGGLLISLGRTRISPDNMLQVEKARLLRSKLVAEKFIDVQSTTERRGSMSNYFFSAPNWFIQSINSSVNERWSGRTGRA